MLDYSTLQRDRSLADRDIPLRPATSALARGLVVKRGFDVAMSLMLLLMFLPVLIMIAAAIKLESRGPVFFRQRRGGLAGQAFLVVKFRTMTVLEDGPELTQATRNDPRVTRVGSFLRRTSLDELPQLLNVLAGDMSLVGPRPHALSHDKHYGRLIGRYQLRFRMKPGITGLAQVSGHRGETATLDAMAARVEADIRYIEHWSFREDLRILVATARIVLFDRSAY